MCMTIKTCWGGRQGNGTVPPTLWTAATAPYPPQSSPTYLACPRLLVHNPLEDKEQGDEGDPEQHDRHECVEELGLHAGGHCSKLDLRGGRRTSVIVSVFMRKNTYADRVGSECMYRWGEK